MLPIRTILHPTDFSDPARAAFDLACSLARDYGAELVVLHVAELVTVVPVGGILVPAAIGDAEQFRPQLEQLRPTDQRVRVRHRLTAGVPAQEILATAAAEKADLIVMGTHGRSGLAHLLTGSVAEAVLRKAPCPVLSVKTPAAATQVEQFDQCVRTFAAAAAATA